MAEHGEFRRDLLYRLRGGTIQLAPLRERKADIPVLVRLFLGSEIGIAPNAVSLLLKPAWPGNVRELSMAVSVLKARATNGLIDRGLVQRCLGPRVDNQTSTGERDTYRDQKSRALLEFEFAYFTDLMRSADGNVTRAARIAGLDRKNLREKLKAVGVYAAR
jgi:DNA-binding NtrC family response regulator